MALRVRNTWIRKAVIFRLCSQIINVLFRRKMKITRANLAYMCCVFACSIFWHVEPSFYWYWRLMKVDQVQTVQSRPPSIDIELMTALAASGLRLIQWKAQSVCVVCFSLQFSGQKRIVIFQNYSFLHHFRHQNKRFRLSKSDKRVCKNKRNWSY